MNVRCERCGTVYEFDEAKATEAGVPVKCSSCSHVFLVRRSAATTPTAPLPAPSEKPRNWKVRQSNGNVFTFRELTTLQRWIVERKVFRDDEISLTGETWKRLGNIPELASFFQVVEAAERAALLEAAMPQAAVSPAPAASPAAPSQPSDGSPPWMAAPVPEPAPQPQPAAAQPSAPAPQSPPRVSAPALDSNLSANELDESELAVVRGGGKGKLVAGLLGVAALVAGGYVLVNQGAPDALTPASVEPAEERVASDEPEAIEQVAEPLVEVVDPLDPSALPAAGDDTAPEVVPAKAVEPAQAEEEKELEEKDDPEPPPAKQVAGAPQERDFDWYIQQGFRMRERNRAKAALDYYARAEELNPNSPEPHAGMGYALFDLGNVDAAIASFERALERSPRYGEALLGLAEAWKEKRDKRKAIDYYRRYIDAVPNGPEVGVARSNIERLSQP